MNKNQRLLALLEIFELGKTYAAQGAYYRIKHYGDDLYSLQKSVPGMCGEKTAHPSLKFHWSDQVIAYQFYVDFETQPMVMTSFTPDDQAFFDEAMARLLADFEKVSDAIK